MYNRFLYAFGVGVLAWGLFKLLDWFLLSLARVLTSFASWYQFSASPYADRMAIAAAVAYLLVAAVFSSRNN